jgi:hypothetical protein
MIQQGYRYPRAVVGFALARDWKREGLRDILYAWRWPGGLLAAVIVWLALVTVVGATTLVPRATTGSAPWAGDGFRPGAAGSCTRCRTGYNPNVINMVHSGAIAMPDTIGASMACLAERLS